MAISVKVANSFGVLVTESSNGVPVTLADNGPAIIIGQGGPAVVFVDENNNPVTLGGSFSSAFSSAYEVS